ncbi:PRC-barrel domain-containing protein [Paracoccus sp. (in: a-proteobacteria)]|uniref:PRC-barrel domain-containing protein n=1 Tax=Paracoccus sp. TaxID=267 RepID=UPI0026E08322|nr:PRC-barrel domain-containing protein [Paracoccus sp. (in: a-proteobacteria)]MDO5648943.1 PRC-barrel domain-containing protein [Paracoccus sp. (in: a-proteobacteria)]
MNRLMMTTAAVFALTAPAFAQTTAPAAPATDGAVVTQPAGAPAATAPATTATTTTAAHGTDHQRPTVSAATPGVTASWLQSRSIYTTNQPRTTAWDNTAHTAHDVRPDNWENIANVSDLVMTDDGHLVGYTADIGGFLGLGARTVLLGADELHIVRAGDDTYLVTNYTREELENLPEFDMTHVHN